MTKRSLVYIIAVALLTLGLSTGAAAHSHNIVGTFHIDWEAAADQDAGVMRLNIHQGKQTLHEELIIPWGLTNEETVEMVADHLASILDIDPDDFTLHTFSGNYDETSHKTNGNFVVFAKEFEESRGR